MTDYIFEGRYSWSEDNSPLYTLGTLDRLTIATGAFLNSLGSNSPIARIQGGAAIQLNSNATVWAENVAFHSTSSGVSFDLYENSTIYTGGIGILIEADPTGSEARNTINVAPTAAIHSRNDYAISSSGHTTVNNQGTIHSSSAHALGLVFADGHNNISNSGNIHGGILIYGGENRIFNESFMSATEGPVIYLSSFIVGESNLVINKGDIYSGLPHNRADVVLVANGPANVTLENEGTPYRDAYIYGGIYLGSGHDVVKNLRHAFMLGNIDLGSGDDRFENHGQIEGNVFLGEGADSLTNHKVIIGTFNGGADNDSVTNYGDVYGDVLLGAGNDEFFGYGSVTGTVHGGSGTDKLHGGNGEDRLNGGDGGDYLHGGAGRDTFIFDAPVSAKNIDKIDDFNGLEDRIQLARSAFQQLNPGDLDPNAFCAGAAPADASDRIGYNYATGAVWYDPDGTGFAKAVTFLWLRPGLSYISANDFFVV